ncbi:hypothetical protein [Leminorella richardii]|nr:hypothetical protein [Leminorella richardii]
MHSCIVLTINQRGSYSPLLSSKILNEPDAVKRRFSTFSLLLFAAK